MPKQTFAGFLSFGYKNGFDYPILNEKLSLFHRLDELSLFYSKFSVRYGISSKKVASLDEILLKDIEKLEGYVDFETRREEYRYSEYTSDIDYIVNMEIGGHNLYKELKEQHKRYIELKKIPYLILEVEYKNEI